MQNEVMLYLSSSTAVAPRSFDEICEDSRTYVDVSDVAAWRIGDNAIEVLERYSDKTLADYAMEIRKPKGTIGEYRKMSAYFDKATRDELYATCPGISRSHMRKVLSIKDKVLGRSFVENAAKRGWTVDRFGYILKRYKQIKGIGTPPKPKPVRETFEATILFPEHDILLEHFDWLKVEQLVKEHAATVQIVVTWTPDAGKETT